MTAWHTPSRISDGYEKIQAPAADTRRTPPDHRRKKTLRGGKDNVISEVHGNLYFIPDGVFYKNLQKFLDNGFAGVDRKESTDDNMANKKLSVRWQLEQERLAKEKEGK